VVARAERLNASWSSAAKFQLASSEDDGPSILAAFREASERAPSFVRGFDRDRVAWLFSLAREADDADEQAFAINEGLLRAGYRGPSTSVDGELAVGHARALLERGEIERARARLPEHVSPELVLLLRTRELFAPLRSGAAIEAKLDYRAAAEEAVAIGTAEWEAKPSESDSLLAAIKALRALGRPQDAIELGQRGLNLLEIEPSEDADEGRRWILNELAYAHYELAQADRARETLERSAAIPEFGTPNVSQRINWATQLMFDSRPDEALVALETLGAASPYGKMWAAAVRVCAYEQLGRSSEREVDLAWMRPQEEVNPAALQEALLCADRGDEGAALLVRRLSKSDQQEDAFAALHPTQSSAAEERPFAATIHARFQAIARRPEVREAAAALGTIESIPLRGTYWGAF
jgi:tetratricopeptide (TPR) repeat protein